jgi:CDP-paratose 2-epimerase
MSTAGLSLITGGAGFVGINLAERLLTQGRRVLLLDNLSRPGVDANVRWLLGRHRERIDIQLCDLLDARAVHAAVRRASEVYHLGAQVADSTSLTSPLADGDVNIRGTLHVLEAVRTQPRPPPLVFTSTSKVYGALGDIELVREGTRYLPASATLRQGIDERQPLDLHGPHACSKGAADQYVRDYARSYGLATVVLRTSCVYGPRQMGSEEQGWVAHFMRAALAGEPLTVFGDGCQVRDLLYVEDLLHALQSCMQRAEVLAGQVFNVGGGPANAVSLLELMGLVAERVTALRGPGHRVPVRHAPWRQAEPRYYVSQCARLIEAVGWSPQVRVPEGLERLSVWLTESLPGYGYEPAPSRAVLS